MPIERAKMKLKVTAPARDTKKVMEKMKQLNCQIEEESHDPDLILVSISLYTMKKYHGSREGGEGVWTVAPCQRNSPLRVSQTLALNNYS